ncbi:GDP-mannose 4,6-dehydratase [Halorubrum sp. SD626R]|uniref:GDP-mannose 4,6-dehydratase n=1 Tax=Halorubrum sp. SD626R TaxID=1419722 RepID=UPI000B8241BC|nr:GDP-mannose 4,6-dehydratase [Halorubrum sp. SD626R]TKX82249.1 NAD-dependent epimerase/dehydratase family protein [Halorubrum sp. SD626R]
MTTLVTGGGGFIGSHLVDFLMENTTEDVRVLDDFSTGSRSNLSHLDTDRARIINGDIREKATVKRAAKGVDTIFHLAAAVGVQNVVNNPLESLEINLHGTEHVLDAADSEMASTFIASSSEVYGKSDEIPFSEDGDRVLGPTNIPRWGYASAKAVDEFLGLAYQDERDIPVVVGRYFNIVGPRQTGEYGMVVPRFIEQAHSDEELTVYGDGTQKRSFTHVNDAVKATYELLQIEEAHGEVYNIGSPNPTRINDLAKAVIEATDSDSTPTHIPFEEIYGENFEEPERREPDVSKLRETLGWVPDTSLEKIISDILSRRQRGETDDE